MVVDHGGVEDFFHEHLQQLYKNVCPGLNKIKYANTSLEGVCYRIFILLAFQVL